MSKEDSYSFKEIIAEFRKEMAERFDKVDDAQAHTNGDVSDLKVWKAFLTGGLAVVTLIVIPLLVYVWQQSQHQLQTIDTYKQKYEVNNQ